MKTLSSETLTGLIPALIVAQAAFKPAVKDARNTHFGNAYLTLGAALDATLPALNENGLALVQHVTTDEAGGVVLVTRLYHANGEWLSSEYPVVPTRSDPQGFGSALTYARRYSAMALVGLAAEDDDARAACDPAPRPKAEQRARVHGPPARSHGVPTALTGHGASDVADLADAIDNAGSLDQLELLVPVLQTAPADMLPPLRRRFSERRDQLSDGPPA